MTKEKIAEEIKKTARENRLACEEARALAQTLGVPIEEIGAVCNELKIKITSCRLGCF